MRYGYDNAVFSGTMPPPYLVLIGGDRLAITRDTWEGRHKVRWGRVQEGVGWAGGQPAPLCSLATPPPALPSLTQDAIRLDEAVVLTPYTSASSRFFSTMYGARTAVEVKSP